MATPTLLIIFLLALGTEFGGAVQIAIQNNCPYTIWAASLNPGGGQELPSGQTWRLDLPAGTKGGRIWGRTGCNFGSGKTPACDTGDCGGALVCSVSGATPSSLVEYSLNRGSDQDQDFYDLSLVDGFNLPVSISPTKPGGSPNCRAISCAKDLNAGCPADLKVQDSAIACKSACTAFPDRDDFCCRGKYGSGPSACPPSYYASYFKQACPDAYSYAYDDKTSTFTCPSGSTDYDVVFCP